MKRIVDSNGQVVRKAFDCRGKYNAKLEDIVDMSKNFTISMWIMPTSTWSDKAIQITDGSNTLSISLVGGTSKEKEIHCGVNIHRVQSQE